jgi:ribosome-binding protein aMBF1 (putative translation factor)
MESDKRRPKPDYSERFKLNGSSFESVVKRVLEAPAPPNGVNGYDSSEHDRLIAIATLVRERRAALGWSQRKLASVADVDQSTIKSLENAERLPRAATMHKMAEALETQFPHECR